MIDYDEMTNKLASTLEMVFPDYPVEIKPDYDDEFIISVNVFAVPAAVLEEVKDRVYSLCDSLLEGTGYLAGIVVRNIERTRQYYPEFLPPPHPVALAQLWTQEILLTECGYTEAYSYRPQAATEYTQLPKDNFALAA